MSPQRKRRKPDSPEIPASSSQPPSAFALRERLRRKVLATAQNEPALISQKAQKRQQSPELEAPASSGSQSDHEAGIEHADQPPGEARRGAPESRRARNGSSLQRLRAAQETRVQSWDVGDHSPDLAASAQLGESKLRDPKQIPVVQLSNFQPTRSNLRYMADGSIVLKLSGGERLVILGSYGIQVTSGEVTVYGATLGPSAPTSWVHAPCCHALPVLRCVQDDSVVELKAHPSAASLRRLGRISPHFRRIWNEAPHEKLTGKSLVPNVTFQPLYATADGPKTALLHELASPPEWNRAIADVLGHAQAKVLSVMITGPKSSGKSTFGRIATNRLVATDPSRSPGRRARGVAILDLDPGQPEYCPPGQISLVHVTQPVLGPPFCHPLSEAGTLMVRSHTLASVSPAADPELYVEAARDLMTHYRSVLNGRPLIINTPGWIQGTGLDLLTTLVADLKPTTVAYMSESGPAEAVEALRDTCRGGSFLALPSQTSQYASLPPASFRSMQTQSYFHSENGEPSTEGQLLTWNSDPIASMVPWQVNYSGPSRGILGIMYYDYQAPLELLAETINGRVLAAVEIETPLAFRQVAVRSHRAAGGDGSATHEEEVDPEKSPSSPTPSISEAVEELIQTTPEGIPFIETNGATLDPRYSQTVGLVFIRGIDVKGGSLQIITPIPDAKIEQMQDSAAAIVLVSGKFDPPSWAYTEALYGEASDETRAEAEQGRGAEDSNGKEREGSTSDTGYEGEPQAAASTRPVPWIELLHANQKRGAGSMVWRVRRDLGRAGNPTD